MSLHALIRSVLPAATEVEEIIAKLDRGISLSDLVNQMEQEPYGSEDMQEMIDGVLRLIVSLESIIGKEYTWMAGSVRDHRVFNLRDMAEYYYANEPASDGLTQAKSDSLREKLFLIHPMIVLETLVKSDKILVDVDLKPLIVQVLSSTRSNGFDISFQSLRLLYEMFDFPDDVDPARRSRVLSFLKDLQRLQAIVTRPEQIGSLFKILHPGQRSARIIAARTAEAFQHDALAVGLSNDSASDIYRRAVIVNTRNEQSWADLLKSKTDNLLPALQTTAKDTDNSNASNQSNKPNFVSIFHETETYECSDCNSVLSPAAYFVDLLQRLKDVEVSNEASLLKFLSDRRPDLKDLELSCSNTKTLIPYIDLVNEVLESFISMSMSADDNGLGNRIEAHNTSDWETSSRLEEEPQNYDPEVYQTKILSQLHPFNVFPYNSAIDSMRAFLKASGFSLFQLRDKLRSEFRLFNSHEYSYDQNQRALISSSRNWIQRAVAAEYLNLSEEDMIAITRQSFVPVERLRLLGSEYATLSENECAKLRDFRGTAAYWGYEAGSAGLASMLDPWKKGTGLAFVKNQLLKRSNVSFEELLEVLKTHFIARRLMITSSDGSLHYTSHIDDLRLQCSELVNDTGLLTEEVCFDLQAFLRLRERTKWEIPTLDAAINCIVRGTQSYDASITPQTLDKLAAMSELSSLTAQSIERLLPLWAPFDTNSTSSLYSILFLNPKADGWESFSADSEGQFFSTNKGVTIENAVIFISSALQVSTSELSQIAQILGYQEDTLLTIDNLTAIYRVITFSQIVGVAIPQLPTFQSIFGVPPLEDALDPRTTLDIVKRWSELLENGWTLEKLSMVTRTVTTIDASGEDSMRAEAQSKSLLILRAIMSRLKLGTTWKPMKPDQGQSASKDDLNRICMALYGGGNIGSIVEKRLQDMRATLVLQSDDQFKGAVTKPQTPQSSKPRVEESDIQTTLYNDLVNILKERLLKEQIFEALKSEFADAEPATLRLITSDIAKTKTHKSPVDTIRDIAEELDQASKDISEGYFTPANSGKYYFNYDLEKDAKLVINGAKVDMKEGSASSVSLLSGQEYHIQLDQLLSGLSWRSESPLKEAFPLENIIPTSHVDTVVDGLSAVARVVTVVNVFKLNLEEVEFFASTLGEVQLDFANIHLTDIEKLEQYRRIRDTLPARKDNPLLRFYKSIELIDSTESGQLARMISQITLWPEKDVQELLDAKYPSLSHAQRIERFKRVSEFSELLTAFDIKQKLKIDQVSMTQVFEWAAPPVNNSGLFQNAAKLRTALHNRNNKGNEIKSAFSNAHNLLRENQRSVLVQYILNDADFCKKAGIVDSDSLFEYLLIDVNTGPKLQTSRLKQAISTVQLFVQRLFLGLETLGGQADNISDAVADLRTKWDYMGRYTLWEAHRKVFLYPENWAEPSLRDNKSEQFQALEATILQNDLSTESVANALQTYIFDINAIANLDTQSYLWERHGQGEGRFHFFARTRTVPFQFYYRSMDLQSYGNRFTYWHPWTKLDLGNVPQYVNKDGKVASNATTYLIPTVVRGRLFLFIPEITLKTQLDESSKSMSTPFIDLANKKASDLSSGDMRTTTRNWEMKMAWIENRNGKWLPKVYSPDSLIIREITGETLPNLSDFRFRVRARSRSGLPKIDIANAKSNRLTTEASFENGVTEVLIIDVETFSVAGEVTSAQLHGQFEMRDSQVYVKKPEAAVVKSGTTQKSMGTYYSKIVWSMSGLPDFGMTDKYSYEVTLENGEKRTRWKEFVNDPLLAGYKGEVDRTLSWTVSFDDSQYPRPLGLVVDVLSTSQGPQSYFALPPEDELQPDMKSQALTDYGQSYRLDHPVAALLVESASKTSDTGTMLKALREGVQDSDFARAFGLMFGKIYHELASPYSLYDWELGVHTCSLLMESLMATQQFEQALQVARLVFDPTRNPSANAGCWLFPPFADPNIQPQTVSSLLELMNQRSHEHKLSYTDLQVLEWQKNPFNAHAVARGRPVTYMKRIVMKYIEILIAAGDEHFRQASMETIPLAIQRYIEASHAIGPGMRKVKPLGHRPNKTFNQIENDVDSFSNTSVDLELEFPFSCLKRKANPGALTNERPEKAFTGLVSSTYFCVPTNPQLLSLRDLIDDRLFKIRNCQDINGNQLRLPLFDPPIDPGMLVRQAAMGSSSPTLYVNDMNTLMPNYRFQYLLSKAYSMTAELKSSCDLFLSIKEKRDAEALAKLKSQQESKIQSMIVKVKQLQKEQALKSIETLTDLQASHESRLSYYLALIGEPTSLIPKEMDDWNDIQQQIDRPTQDDLKMSSNEKLEMMKANDAANLTFRASLLDTTASVLYALPNLSTNAQPMGVGVSLKMDAENVAKSITGASTVLKLLAEHSGNESSRAGRKAQMIRQLQERKLQANMAGRDIKNLDKQIASAKSQISICDAEIKIQDTQLAQASETLDWYTAKYTGEQLYAWMDSSIRKLLYQAYLFAIDVAKKAEKAHQFECGDNAPAPFLDQKGYWDSGRDGLLAAQRIQLALQTLEMAHVDKSISEFEISKTISLRQVNPQALFNLRLNGQAQFSLPEVLFDLDFPGHFFRRIKTVSVNIPCITGPYTSLNCTLSLLEHRYRINAATPSDRYVEQERDERFRTDRIPISSIAVGERSVDTGRFELNFQGERYMPFENAGLISTWKIELPTKARHFDYDTISDVVLQIRYTSRQGGGKFKGAAEQSLSTYFSQAQAVGREDSGLSACIDLKNDYFNEFFALTTPGSAVEQIVLKGLKDRMPFWTRGRTLKAKSLTILVRCVTTSDGSTSVTTSATPYGGNFELTNASRVLSNGKALSEGWTQFISGDLDLEVGDWTLKATTAAGAAASSSSMKSTIKVERILLLFRYVLAGSL